MRYRTHDSLVGIVKSATTSTRDKKVEVAVVQDGDNRYHVAHRHLFDLKQHVTCCVLHGVFVFVACYTACLFVHAARRVCLLHAARWIACLLRNRFHGAVTMVIREHLQSSISSLTFAN